MKNKILITVGLIIFIDNVGSGMIMPLLPTLFMNNSLGLMAIASPVVKSFYFGLSYMLFPIVATFSNPYLGYLSDYKGRKFVITMGMVGFIGTNLVAIIAITSHNLWLFLLSRLLAGFFGGSYVAAGAALMDIASDEKEKIFNVKIITFVSILGFVISPAFSVLVPSKLTSISLTIPFVIVFLLSILNLILIILFFPNTKYRMDDTPLPNTLTILSTSLLFLLKNPNIRIMGICFFLFQLGYNFYFQVIAINLQQIHNFSISQTGLFFLIMGSSYTCGMYILHPFFSHRLSNTLVTNIGIIFSALFIGVLGMNEILAEYFKNSYYMNYMLWILNILFFITIPMASINMYKQFIDTSHDKQGLIIGVAGQITSLALITSGLLIGLHAYIYEFETIITTLILVTAFILNVVIKLGRKGN